jgi:multisubunit Na+/H+ antiporter MnhG subunit
VRKNDAHAGQLVLGIGGCVLVGVVSLISVLLRRLENRYDRAHAERYEGRTLILFVFGISITFVGVLLELSRTFMRSPVGGE